MRWKEPRAFAAADHASPRAHQRRGRRTIRRRVRGQCVEGRGAAGRLIPHARAIRALVIAMIEASFRAPPMALSGRPDRGPTRVGTADRGAIGMAPIARRADREEAVAAPTDLLEKRRVHGVGAAAVRSDWTYRPNRGTTDKAASARRSPRRSRGPGGSVRALTLSLRSLRDQPFPRPVPRPWTVPRLWTHRTRPQVAWKTAQNAVSHTAHRLLVFTVEKTDERSQARTARRPPSGFTRFQMSADR